MPTKKSTVPSLAKTSDGKIDISDELDLDIIENENEIITDDELETNENEKEVNNNDIPKNISEEEKLIITQIKKCMRITSNFVEYEKIKDFIGCKQKRTVKEALENKNNDYVLNKDYYFKNTNRLNVKKPVEEIYMTKETIKRLCISNIKSKAVQNYILNNLSENGDIKTVIDGPIDINHYQNFDIDDLLNTETLYLIHVRGLFLKFGVTGNILKRTRSHYSKLNYNKIIKVWDVSNRTIGKKIEDAVKLYANQNKIKSSYLNETEIIKTNEIAPIIKIIDDYVSKYIVEYNNIFVDFRLKQVNENLKLAIEAIKGLQNLIDTVASNDDLKGFADLFSSKIGNDKINIIDSIIEDVIECETHKQIVSKSIKELTTAIDVKKNSILQSVNEVALPEPIKCGRCDANRSEKDFKNIKQPDKPYKYCEHCRKYESEYEKKKRVEK
jgi:hypothetical protein